MVYYCIIKLNCDDDDDDDLVVCSVVKMELDIVKLRMLKLGCLQMSGNFKLFLVQV